MCLIFSLPYQFSMLVDDVLLEASNLIVCKVMRVSHAHTLPIATLYSYTHMHTLTHTMVFFVALFASLVCVCASLLSVCVYVYSACVYSVCIYCVSLLCICTRMHIYFMCVSTVHMCMRIYCAYVCACMCLNVSVSTELNVCV